MRDNRPKLILHVVQGEHAISTDEEAALTSVLGSCIAVCLRDPIVGIGGMNHFLLPEGSAHSSTATMHGAQAMEILINALLKRGARKERLEAKVFGGAQMMAGLSDIGRNNTIFARRFLNDEGIPCLAESTGGTQARRIYYWPVTGRARQMLVAKAPEMFRPKPVVAPTTHDVELF